MSLNLGIDHKIGKNLSISFAPAAGKFTFVSDDELSAAGAYGVDPGEKFRAEFGTNLLATLSVPLMEKLHSHLLLTSLLLTQRRLVQ